MSQYGQLDSKGKGGGIRLYGRRIGLNVGLELLVWKVVLCGLEVGQMEGWSTGTGMVR